MKNHFLILLSASFLTLIPSSQAAGGDLECGRSLAEEMGLVEAKVVTGDSAVYVLPGRRVLASEICQARDDAPDYQGMAESGLIDRLVKVNDQILFYEVKVGQLHSRTYVHLESDEIRELTFWSSAMASSKFKSLMERLNTYGALKSVDRLESKRAAPRRSKD